VSIGAAVLVGAGTALALTGSAWLSWCRAHLVTVIVTGSSMAPTLSTYDRVVVRRARGHRLAAGQLVVFAAPVREAGAWVWRPADDPVAPTWVIKRIAAVADDPVPPAVASAVPAAVVPAGTIVVLGENLDTSVDSRLFGQVPIECVLGSVTGRWPASMCLRP
jgi:signal peptidase I